MKLKQLSDRLALVSEEKGALTHRSFQKEIDVDRIDWTKPVEHVNGFKLRVLCTDGPGSHPVLCIDSSGDVWRFPLDTKSARNVPSVHKLWINLDTDGGWSAWATKEEADVWAEPNRIGCHHITWGGPAE